MKTEETIHIRISTRGDGSRSFSISRSVNGKNLESYRPVDETQIFMDFASIINGFEPERSPRCLSKPTD